MYDEDDLIPISALQHLMFCERQFALIHLEGAWKENRFTAEGRASHDRVDAGGHESRRSIRQEYAMAIRSLELGIVGKTDLVEIHLRPDGGVDGAVPVEFKRGRDKENDCDRVQLCAQALCLEKMLDVSIPCGDFYYFGAHRRTHVTFDDEIKQTTLAAINRAREILDAGITPAARYAKRTCDRCSLIDACMPKTTSGEKRVGTFMENAIAAMRKECGA